MLGLLTSFTWPSAGLITADECLRGGGLPKADGGQREQEAVKDKLGRALHDSARKTEQVKAGYIDVAMMLRHSRLPFPAVRHTLFAHDGPVGRPCPSLCGAGEGEDPLPLDKRTFSNGSSKC